MRPPLFHVVLHEPEIPNNTGAIGRTCIATGCALHLVHPIGFDTSVKALRRAGLDYWPRLDVSEHPSWDAYQASAPGAARWLYAARGETAHWDAALRPGDHLVFGKETAGLPREILDAHPDRIVTVPMLEGERSLNLANVVCAAIAEGVRQCVTRGDVRIDARGRLKPD